MPNKTKQSISWELHDGEVGEVDIACVKYVFPEKEKEKLEMSCQCQKFEILKLKMMGGSLGPPFGGPRWKFRAKCDDIALILFSKYEK